MRSLPDDITSLPWVHNYGFLNKNNPAEYRTLIEIMKTQDIFLFPSKAECSSIALCEANAFGLALSMIPGAQEITWRTVRMDICYR